MGVFEEQSRFAGAVGGWVSFNTVRSIAAAADAGKLVSAPVYQGPSSISI